MTTTNNYISTPGEILLEEFLQPLGISQYRLAKVIRKPQSAISDIVNGRRAITTEMAWLLAKALGTTPEFWLNLQMTYEAKTFDPERLPPIASIASDRGGEYVYEERLLSDWMQPEGDAPAEARRRALRELAGVSKGGIPKGCNDIYIEHLAEKHVFAGVRS